MEAVVCSRTGWIPKSLEPGPGTSESSPDSKSVSASVAVRHDAASPMPGPREASSGKWVRVRVAAASLNFADVLTVMGKYQERPPLPFIPGAEVSGTVLEVGPAVRAVSVGDRVCAVVGTGGFAGEVIAEERKVFPLPSACDLASACALPVAYGTAHLALQHRAGLQPGEVLLVLGAAGGVGLAAVQLGKLMGATVIAVARGPEKAQVLREAGADGVVDSSVQGVREGVKSLLQEWRAQRSRGQEHATATADSKGRGGRQQSFSGVDVVLDTVGGSQFDESLKVVSWGARVLVIGFASGKIPSIPANIALVKNLTVHGIYWGSYMDRDPAVLRASMDTLLHWLAQGDIRIRVSHRLPFPKVLEAFHLILSRAAIGKVLLEPSQHSRL